MGTRKSGQGRGDRIVKEEAISLARNIADPAQRLNMLREYLQALVLRSLHESEAFQCLAFVGGTALRFLYGLPRFSEDLDFSLDSSKGYALEKWMIKIKRDCQFAGLDATITQNDCERRFGMYLLQPI